MWNLRGFMKSEIHIVIMYGNCTCRHIPILAHILTKVWRLFALGGEDAGNIAKRCFLVRNSSWICWFSRGKWSEVGKRRVFSHPLVTAMFPTLLLTIHMLSHPYMSSHAWRSSQPLSTRQLGIVWCHVVAYHRIGCSIVLYVGALIVLALCAQSVADRPIKQEISTITLLLCGRGPCRLPYGGTSAEQVCPQMLLPSDNKV